MSGLPWTKILPPQLTSQIVASVAGDGRDLLCWQQPFFVQPPVAALPGSLNLDLKLFGVLPLKRITLQVVPPVKVMVGGQSIGVLLHATGVIVCGYTEIAAADGSSCCPARQAGIALGDIVISIGGIPVENDAQLGPLVDQLARSSDALQLRVKHQGVVTGYEVKPVLCRDTNHYRIGLLVRDGAAGVGTLTFYDPVSLKYGALGHAIANPENNEPLDLRDGRIVAASVEGIQKGQRGKIGEKIGIFQVNQEVVGSIEKNTRYGIFGALQRIQPNQLYPNPVPVAVGGQIKAGPAQLLTVLSGDKIEAFTVEIQSVFTQPRPDGKSFIVKIVDPRILSQTGGIVQGMSGSPIVQDGKLVGAVTHVFVNDPGSRLRDQRRVDAGRSWPAPAAGHYQCCLVPNPSYLDLKGARTGCSGQHAQKRI